MVLGQKQSVVCYDEIRRTGVVVYIHPQGLYRVLEFKGKSGKYREAFMIQNPKRCINRVSKRDRPYSDQENALILSERLPAEQIAKLLGVSTTTIYKRRRKLKQDKENLQAIRL